MTADAHTDPPAWPFVTMLIVAAAATAYSVISPLDYATWFFELIFLACLAFSMKSSSAFPNSLILFLNIACVLRICISRSIRRSSCDLKSAISKSSPLYR